MRVAWKRRVRAGNLSIVAFQFSPTLCLLLSFSFLCLVSRENQRARLGTPTFLFSLEKRSKHFRQLKFNNRGEYLNENQAFLVEELPKNTLIVFLIVTGEILHNHKD